MKSKRIAIEVALRMAGSHGVDRAIFEADRHKFGTSFIRRLQELEEKLIIEKKLDGNFITRWTLIGSRNMQPVAAVKGKEIYIGSVANMNFFEVAR